MLAPEISIRDISRQRLSPTGPDQRGYISQSPVVVEYTGRRFRQHFERFRQLLVNEIKDWLRPNDLGRNRILKANVVDDRALRVFQRA